MTPWLFAFLAITGAVVLTALVTATLFASIPRYREDAERLAITLREGAEVMQARNEALRENLRLIRELNKVHEQLRLRADGNQPPQDLN
jgi:hypothetical protein